MKKRALRKIKRISKPKTVSRHWAVLITGAAIIFLIAFVASFIAQPIGYATLPVNLVEGGKQIVQVITDFSQPLLEALLGVSSYDEYFFSKALLFILLAIIIFSVLQRIEIFQGRPGITRILSFIIALLGIRYLVSAEIINAVLLPYGTLAIAITVFLPFLIYFYFVHQNVPGTSARRLAWILFGIFFIGIWYKRGSDVGDAGWMYLAGIIAVAVSMILDQQIHQYFGRGANRAIQRRLLEDQMIGVRRDIAQLIEDQGRNIITQQHFDQRMREYQTRLDDLHRRLAAL